MSFEEPEHTDSEGEKEELIDNCATQLSQGGILALDSHTSESNSAGKTDHQCWGMLLCKENNTQYRLYHRVHEGYKDRYTLGRHSTADITVSDKRISSKHCYIYCDYEESRLRVFLEDASINGTFLNDSLTRLRRNERIQLKSGDDIYLINPRYVCNDDGNKCAAFLFINMRERLMAQRAVGVAPVRPQLPSTRPDPATQVVQVTSPRFIRHIEDDYVIGDEIGKGMSGVVYLCTHRLTGTARAVKIIDTKKFGLTPGLSTDELRAEAQIMKTLNHPHIIRIFDTFESNNVIYIVMELVRGGDLFDSIVVKGRYSEREAQIVVKQLLSAVQYMHSNDIIHRDLKPENILLMDSGENNLNSNNSAGLIEEEFTVNVRITDFGLAKRTTQEGLKTFCGTPQYFAPEVLKRRSSVSGAGRYGKAADMWSIGVILFILLSGTFPFDEDDLFEQIASAHYTLDGAEWHFISTHAKDLIRRLMTLHPHERFTVTQALNHPWVLCSNEAGSSRGEKEALPACSVSADLQPLKGGKVHSEKEVSSTPSASFAPVVPVSASSRNLSVHFAAAKIRSGFEDFVSNRNVKIGAGNGSIKKRSSVAQCKKNAATGRGQKAAFARSFYEYYLPPAELPEADNKQGNTATSDNSNAISNNLAMASTAEEIGIACNSEGVGKNKENCTNEWKDSSASAPALLPPPPLHDGTNLGEGLSLVSPTLLLKRKKAPGSGGGDGGGSCRKHRSKPTLCSPQAFNGGPKPVVLPSSSSPVVGPTSSINVDAQNQVLLADLQDNAEITGASGASSENVSGIVLTSNTLGERNNEMTNERQIGTCDSATTSSLKSSIVAGKDGSNSRGSRKYVQQTLFSCKGKCGIGSDSAIFRNPSQTVSMPAQRSSGVHQSQLSVTAVNGILAIHCSNATSAESSAATPSNFGTTTATGCQYENCGSAAVGQESNANKSRVKMRTIREIFSAAGSSHST